MSIEAIETQTTNTYPFGTIAKGSIAGGVLGYVAKKSLPLNASEMDKEYFDAIKLIRINANKAKASAIDTIKNIKDKTPAQDTFVKIVDAANKTENKKITGIRKVIEKANLNSTDMKELTGIISSVNKRAVDMFQRCEKGFKSAVKDKRVTPFYVATGAVLGFFAGLGQSVLKTS